MRNEKRVVEELREWAHRPTALSGEEAARAVLARLTRRQPGRRAVSRTVLLAAAAALIAAAGLYTVLHARNAESAKAVTTAAMTLSSGTQVVIDLQGVKP
jgi:hypothetical protein